MESNLYNILLAMATKVHGLKSSGVNVTLEQNDWALNQSGYLEQTVTVQGVTANNNIIVGPNVTVTHPSAFGELGIRATSQGTNTVTFVCDETPADDIYVNIIILG